MKKLSKKSVVATQKAAHGMNVVTVTLKLRSILPTALQTVYTIPCVLDKHDHAFPKIYIIFFIPHTEHISLVQFNLRRV